MNALVPQPNYHASLPAFLRDPTLFAESDKAIAGISGGQPPAISIKASKWRLVGADGEELMVNQLHLDVFVLAGNEHVSKTFYAGAYNPAVTDPPACFSDNGIGPSLQSSTPQSVTCAACAHNAWGSKVNEQTGNRQKACGDSKKLAIVLAADTPYVSSTGAAGIAPALDQVYLLRVPTMSMRNWKDYAKELIGRGVPVIGAVTRMEFDAQTAYPAILFKIVGFASEAQFGACKEMMVEADTLEMIGANDRVTAQAPALPVPAHLAAPAPVAPAPTPAPVMVPPAPVQPAAPVAVPMPRRQRGRPIAGPSPVMVPPAPVQTAAPLAPAPVAPAPLVAAPAPAIQPVQASDASLDALLAATLGPAKA